MPGSMLNKKILPDPPAQTPLSAGPFKAGEKLGGTTGPTAAATATDGLSHRTGGPPKATFDGYGSKKTRR